MIRFYSHPQSYSSNRVKDWLLYNNLPFFEIVLNSQSLFSKEEFFHILSLSDLGVDDLLSKRSKYYNEFINDIQDYTLDELLDLFRNFPSLLKRPILVDDKKLQIGYNEDEIRKFLPRYIRRIEMKKALENTI